MILSLPFFGLGIKTPSAILLFLCVVSCLLSCLKDQQLAGLSQIPAIYVLHYASWAVSNTSSWQGCPKYQ